MAKVLQIMAERPDGTNKPVDDCELVSRTVAPVPRRGRSHRSGKYHLEICVSRYRPPVGSQVGLADWAGHIARWNASVVHEAARNSAMRIVLGMQDRS